jgi:hypothetical protein
MTKRKLDHSEKIALLSAAHIAAQVSLKGPCIIARTVLVATFIVASTSLTINQLRGNN